MASSGRYQPAGRRWEALPIQQEVVHVIVSKATSATFSKIYTIVQYENNFLFVYLYTSQSKYFTFKTVFNWLLQA